MPTLYTLHLSRHVRGMVKGPVRSVPAVYAGHLCKETGAIVQADRDAVRECLPACYRKAFDRAISIWYPKDGNRPAHMTFCTARGKYFNTLYLQPYVFS